MIAGGDPKAIHIITKMHNTYKAIQSPLPVHNIQPNSARLIYVLDQLSWIYEWLLIWQTAQLQTPELP